MNTYTLNVSMAFSAAHSLRGYQGKCARIHGHNYRVKAEIETNQLDDIGLGIDYYDVKQIMQRFIDLLDHYYINDETVSDMEKRFYFVKNKLELENHINLYARGELDSKYSVDMVDKYAFPVGKDNPRISIERIVREKMLGTDLKNRFIEENVYEEDKEIERVI